MAEVLTMDWQLAPHETFEDETRYRLLDGGEVIAVAADPTELFDASELAENEELQEAIRSVIETGRSVMIGGGAAPLYQIIDWAKPAHRRA